MWIILGILAIGATFMNIYRYRKGKDYKLAMAMGLSFTALTINAYNSDMAKSVMAEDWTALIDVAPTMASALWLLTIISILLNVSPIFLEMKRKK